MALSKPPRLLLQMLLGEEHVPGATGKEGPTLIADGAFLSKSILQSKLIILTSDSYEACNCQVLQDQFHEHFPDWLYKIALAILQGVLVTCMRVGMQVLRGSLKVQTARLHRAKSLGWLAKKDLFAFRFLTCQEISKDYGYGSILLGPKGHQPTF